MRNTLVNNSPQLAVSSASPGFGFLRARVAFPGSITRKVAFPQTIRLFRLRFSRPRSE